MRFDLSVPRSCTEGKRCCLRSSAFTFLLCRAFRKGPLSLKIIRHQKQGRGEENRVWKCSLLAFSFFPSKFSSPQRNKKQINGELHKSCVKSLALPAGVRVASVRKAGRQQPWHAAGSRHWKPGPAIILSSRSQER